MKHDAQMLAAIGQWKERSEPRRVEDILVSLLRTDPAIQAMVAKYSTLNAYGRLCAVRLVQSIPSEAELENLRNDTRKEL